jgi:hypothetical protein
MKKLVRLSLFALVLCAMAAPAFARRATVKIINKSKWEIHHIYLSPSDSRRWGPDQLGDDILATGQSLTLSRINCNLYDIKVIDEDGDECVIEQADLCRDNSYWKITDKSLLACEGYEDDDD